ncbi:allatotropin-like [Ceratina calcarata]|uniref:Allatotropin-like n=1 Tax=Ceratina calcarata TaxID=156304 RepID=A0AAJ7J3A3_9HYME|nr:allatotropin-like [Ceratina calcarata]XP_026671206.1 allatotropin-like [Ceratina calcarata]XP_026671207.1 allatotropin-like [Ceratina calcarata]XP_026671208.1 allatotropin-like [Ceratina calcarata]XP_026671209.1 allatotropin-like [Ceratina calcarata]
MRVSIIIILAFATGVIVATTRNHNFSNFVKHHARPRVIRGFIPEHMSTAYGFGKRQSSMDASKVDKNERILSTLLRYFPQGISTEWLLQQMKTNPAFASKLIQLLLDGRPDFVPMSEHFNPERITWLY